MAGCELVTSILLQSAKPIPRCFQLKAKNVTWWISYESISLLFFDFFEKNQSLKSINFS